MVITDVMMPKADGFELAENIRSLDTRVTILFMTALYDNPSKEGNGPGFALVQKVIDVLGV